MRKVLFVSILLAILLAGIIGVGVWSRSFTESVYPSDDVVESSVSQVLFETTEERIESAKPDALEKDKDFWEVSVIPPTIEDEKKVTWVFSEVATFFIEEEGGDPAFVVDWIFATVEKYGYELIIDVDPSIYLEQ